MYSNNGSSYRPGANLYRPGRAGQAPGRYAHDDHGSRPHDRRQNYPDRSSYRDNYRGDYRNGREGQLGAEDHHRASRSHSGYHGVTQSPHGRRQGAYPPHNAPHNSSWLRGPQKPQGNMYHLVYAQILAENQIWMGDLDPRWSEDDIGAIWAELGERPANVKIVRDKAARAQYCFVTFANTTATAAALQRNRTRVPGSSHTFKLKKTSGMGGSADSGRPTPSHAASARNHAEYSLFVGDLATEVSEDMLYARFNQQYPGAIKQVRITSDANTGDSKGFGFVRFVHPDALNASLREMNGVVIGNRAIRVGLANGLEQASRPKKAAETGAGACVAQPQPPLAPSSDPNNSVLALKGITPNVTEDDLVAHFGAFGTLVYCKVDHVQHVAHVKYLLRTSAEKALVFMSGFIINGCSVNLRWGREQKPENSGKYVAAPEPPTFYGDFAPYTVLDRMTETQLAEATISDAQEPFSVEEFNRVHEQALAGRAAYLELAL